MCLKWDSLTKIDIAHQRGPKLYRVSHGYQKVIEITLKTYKKSRLTTLKTFKSKEEGRG